MATETAFVIPEGSLGYWTHRLVEQDIAHEALEKRFGESVLPLRDPDGMRLALVAVKGADQIPGWSNGEVPAEHAIRGFHGVTLMVDDGEQTAQVLTGIFGFTADRREGNLERFRANGDRTGQVIVAISARSISRSPAACCSRSRPTILASPWTSPGRRWAARSSFRPGSNPGARKSLRRCRHLLEHPRGNPPRHSFGALPARFFSGTPAGPFFPSVWRSDERNKSS
jgi:catechol 2,3-dioxygenase-like lactoylglutathione lyase family enzyme